MELADRIPCLYERHAAAWDAARGRGEAFIERGWIDRFLALVPAGGALLDLGCGSGRPIAAHLIARGHRVTGVDSSPSLIALCAARFPEQHWPKQQWIVADMVDLALDRRFDGLLAWDSLFHLDHARQRRMFATLAAHAVPGAALIFTSGPEHGEAIGEWQDEPLYHASLAPNEYRALLASHGFSVVDHVVEDPDCGGRTIWLARRDTTTP